MTKSYWKDTHTISPYMLHGSEIDPGDQAGYKIIATRFEAWPAGWCAYKGPTNWTDEAILQHGDAVDQVIAEKLFPAFKQAGLIYGNL